MNKQTEYINFTVSIDEANKIFKALGNLPFTEVYELIGKLNEQANQQLVKKENNLNSFIGGSSLDIEELLK